jgi:Spy/CpxP family protein refolding chaperone
MKSSTWIRHRFLARGTQLAAVVVIALAFASAAARASDMDTGANDLAKLQTKAEQAPPKDRCFLYAELVDHLAERAGEQLNSGDSGKASESLRLLRQYAEQIGSSITDDSKKLKDAEVITRRAAFRLSSMLRGASFEDRPALDATLKLVYQAQTSLMIQVFKK